MQVGREVSEGYEVRKRRSINPGYNIRMQEEQEEASE